MPCSGLGFLEGKSVIGPSGAKPEAAAQADAQHRKTAGWVFCMSGALEVAACPRTVSPVVTVLGRRGTPRPGRPQSR